MPVAERVVSQYHKLRALEKDQKGKPEGDTAGAIADKLLAKYPGLAASSAPPPGRTPAAPDIGDYSFTDFLKVVATGLGMTPLDKLIDEINKDFPGFIDEAVKQATGHGKRRP